MFGWHKWVEKQEEKKRQQEEEEHRLHVEAIERSRALGDEIRRRNQEKENITQESLGQAHLSPFQKAELLKQSRAVSIAGVKEESRMNFKVYEHNDERMKYMTANGTNLENTADDYKNLYDELMKANKMKKYKYISRNRPELGLGVVYTDQNEIIGLVEYVMDLDELESFEREDIEQFYDLNKFFEVPEDITNMSDFFEWALGGK